MPLDPELRLIAGLLHSSENDQQEPFREIPITGTRLKAKVSLRDYFRLRKIKWHLNPRGYAVHSISKGGYLLMSQAVLGRSSRKKQIDHKYGDKLDNRRSRLRWATNGQNCANKKLPLSRSGYRGVRRINCSKRFPYVARIGAFGSIFHIGKFKSAKSAAIAYNAAAKIAFGSFAVLNPL